jgi:septum formation protein
MPRLTLASSSPRRRQLLEMLGFDIDVRPTNIPEAPEAGEAPGAYAARLAREKVAASDGTLVLGADTIVVLNGHLLEKPTDTEDAVRMLMTLQGHTHEVTTAVALRHDGRIREAADTTRVTFRNADEALIRAYVATGEPMDKAGAYGIQGYGAALIERVEGDFFSVMGLPLRLVLDLLKEAGFPYRFEGASSEQ